MENKKVNCSLSVISSIWIAFFMLAAGLSVFGIMYSSNKQQLDLFYHKQSESIIHTLKTEADQLVKSMRGSAISVYDSEPLLQNCSIPNSNYSSTNLARLFNSLISTSRPLGSLGIIQRYGNTTGKISWQVVQGYGCNNAPNIQNNIPSGYMFASADPSTYPTFLGYCIDGLKGSITNSTPSYVGIDWGLKPLEDLLLANGVMDSVPGNPGTELFLPVFQLLGYFTLTYETVIGCPGRSNYAAVFAEQSLITLDKTVSESAPEGTVILIVEKSTGLLISCNIANQTQTINQDNQVFRTSLSNVTDSTVKEITSVIGYDVSNFIDGTITSTKSGIWITGINYIVTPIGNIGSGIDWVLIIGIRQKSFVDAIKDASIFSISFSMGVLLVGIAITIIGTIFLIRRPLQRILAYISYKKNKDTTNVENGNLYSGIISEIDELSTLVEMDDK